MKEKLMKKVEELRKERDLACTYGNIPVQQYCNYEIAKIAKKLKVDYYSIA